MAFVTKLISEEDAKRTGVFEEAKRFGGPISRVWIIDRERNIYLHVVGREREEFRNRSSWIYFWGGEIYVIELELLEYRGKRGGPGWSHWKVIGLKS